MKGSPVRSLIVHRDYPLDGAPAHGIPRYTQMMAHALAAAGHPTGVLTGGSPGVAHDGPVPVHLVDTAPPRLRGWWRGDRLLPASYLWASRAFARALRSGPAAGAEIVEFAEFRGEGLSYARARRRPPVVIRVHHPCWRSAQFGGQPRTARLWMLHRMEMAALRASDAVTAPTRAFLDLVRGWVNLEGKPARVIPNPLDLARFRPPDAEAPADYLLFASRLEYRKGADLLPALVAGLRGRGIDLEVRVAGGAGRESDFAADVSARLRALPGVKLLGAIGERELVPLMQGALAMLVPSRDENFPYALAEALACGAPVIAARVGGIPEIVSDGVEGMLVAPADVAALADAVRRLHGDRGLRRLLGANARRRAGSLFSLERVAAETADFYGEVIDRGRRPGGRRPAGRRSSAGG
ncbi:MAG TPA: glycosyltransferase family 4 protein [Candidatus Methylomirabilis sp.]